MYNNLLLSEKQLKVSPQSRFSNCECYSNRILFTVSIDSKLENLLWGKLSNCFSIVIDYYYQSIYYYIINLFVDRLLCVICLF